MFLIKKRVCSREYKTKSGRTRHQNLCEAKIKEIKKSNREKMKLFHSGPTTNCC